jgi:hypothetical protein
VEFTGVAAQRLDAATWSPVATATSNLQRLKIAQASGVSDAQAAAVPHNKDFRTDCCIMLGHSGLLYTVQRLLYIATSSFGFMISMLPAAWQASCFHVWHSKSWLSLFLSTYDLIVCARFT